MGVKQAREEKICDQKTSATVVAFYGAIPTTLVWSRFLPIYSYNFTSPLNISPYQNIPSGSQCRPPPPCSCLISGWSSPRCWAWMSRPWPAPVTKSSSCWRLAFSPLAGTSGTRTRPGSVPLTAACTATTSPATAPGWRIRPPQTLLVPATWLLLMRPKICSALGLKLHLKCKATAAGLSIDNMLASRFPCQGSAQSSENNHVTLEVK